MTTLEPSLLGLQQQQQQQIGLALAPLGDATQIQTTELPKGDVSMLAKPLLGMGQKVRV